MTLNEMTFQIGKAGITPGVIESLHLLFKNHKQVRVSLLQSSGRNNTNKFDMAKELAEKLKNDQYEFVTKVIGFTIITKRRLLNNKQVKKQQ